MKVVSIAILASFFFAFFSCEAAPDDVKTLVVENIPQNISLSAASKQALLDSKAYVTIETDAQGNPVIPADGLYVFAALLPNTVFSQLVNDLMNGKITPKNVPDSAEAFCAAEIIEHQAKRRLLSIKDLGAMWEGGQATGYFTALIYITSCARYIVRCDFSVGKYSNAVSEFRYSYSGGDFTPIYEITGNNAPVELLGDDFITEVLGNF